MRRLKTSLLAVGIFSAAILAFIVSFLGAALFSDVDAHMGSRAVKIDADNGSGERGAFYVELADYVRSQEFDITIEYASLAVSNGQTRIYTTLLDRGSGPVEKPRFERGRVDILYPLEDFPQPDPRQIIYLKGSSDDEVILSNWLLDRGFELGQMASLAREIFFTSSIPVLLILSLLLCITLGAGHVLARSREVGIHRLLGLSMVESMIIELRRQRWSLIAALIVTPAIVAGLLFLYNGWALAPVFWGIYAFSAALFFCFLLVGYLAGQVLMRRTSIVQSIKGRVHARPIFYALTLVRCVALVAALSAVSSLVGAAAELHERGRLQVAWDSHRGPQEFALSSNAADEVGIGAEAAAPFRDADRDGDLLLVNPYWITWPTELEAPVLLVNQEFARKAGVSHMSADGASVCAPVKLAGESKGLIKESLEFEAEYANVSAPRVEWQEACALGPVFTYDVDQRPLVDDPILVVLPPGLIPLSDHNLMASVSQHVLISSSPEVPAKLLEGTTGEVLAYQKSRADSWLAHTRSVEQSVLQWGISTVAAVLLVSVLVGATVITFRISYRRKIHIAYICGRSPWWVVKHVVVLEIVFFLGTIAWLLYKLREHRIQAESNVPSTWNIGFENQWAPGVIAGVIGFGLLWLVVAVWSAVRAAGTWDAREGTENQ